MIKLILISVLLVSLSGCANKTVEELNFEKERCIKNGLDYFYYPGWTFISREHIICINKSK